MLKHYAFGALALALGIRATAQPAFTDGSAALTHEAASGGCMAVTDMDGDGLDDIVQLDMGTHITILYQNADHTFTAFDYGTVENDAQWGWAIADVDNNGHKDILSGAYGHTNHVSITSRGVYTLTDLDGPEIFTQCMSMADMNNDGRVDVFACHDNGPPNIWFTNTAGVPVNDNAYIDWNTTPQSDMSGNYGSTFTDFDNDGDIDLYISHCRQGVNDPDDPRRWNRLFVNDGTDHYSDLAAEYGLQSHEQTWTSDFGDYDNDGDLDVVSTNHSTSITLFVNDGTGHYTEVTAGSGLSGTEGFMLQGLFRDLDNDGFLDVMIAGGQGVAAYFQGHGDGTFTKYTNLFPAPYTIHGFAFGDLDQDGFEDVYANYGDDYVDGDPDNPDRLWLNTPNGNHWFNMDLEGTVSNRDAVGARVTITGPWGTQVREVHAGESYGLVNTFTLHFGLGHYDAISTVTVNWPSGLVDTFENVHADQTMMVVEGGCSSVNTSIASSDAAFCTGGTGSITLTAEAGFTYLWNTGATGASINVTEPGTYSVTVSDGGACSTMASIFLQLDPDETPTISVDGPTTFCEYDAVQLTSSYASDHHWSNGGNGQTITVTEGGTYSVQVDGACATFTSEPVTLTMLDSPDAAPESNDVAIPAPGTADLTATGSNIRWYDAAVGGNTVGTGSPWTTPVLNGNTTFWCAEVTQYGGVIANGGAENNATTGGYLDNANNYLLFTATADMVINSVKVYANGSFARTFAVVQQSTGNVIAETTVDVPNGESRVQLGFTVPAGGPYGLRAVGGSPDLWRDQPGTDPAYPFALGTLGSITSSTASGANALEYYYFFYDWEVMSPASYCDGPRTQVEVQVGPVGIAEEQAAAGLHVFPNPANDRLAITFDELTGPVDVQLLDVAGRVVLGQRVNATSTGSVLDISALAPGGYTLRARHADGSIATHVVVR